MSEPTVAPAVPAPLVVVIAPDSFKGSAGAASVAAALATGWRSVRPLDELVLHPMADGGEGTLDALASAFPTGERMPVTVLGPDDVPVTAHWLHVAAPDGTRTGIVELASTSGIELLAHLRPLTAHTRGFGQAVAAALDAGVDRLVLAIGGSSSTDGGAGLLTELGARFTDAAGTVIPDGARGLALVSRADLSGLRTLPPGGAVVLTDVTAPLLGPTGAVAVFGAQKGLTGDDASDVEASLARYASLLGEAVVSRTGMADGAEAAPGAGAAGGTGFGLLVWGAEPRAGADAVARETGLAEAVARADVVITGEGRFDRQSESGKVVGHVRRLAELSGARALLVAGVLDARTDGFAASAALSAPDLAGSSAASLAAPERWLHAAAARLAASIGPAAE